MNESENVGAWELNQSHVKGVQPWNLHFPFLFRFQSWTELLEALQSFSLSKGKGAFKITVYPPTHAPPLHFPPYSFTPTHTERKSIANLNPHLPAAVDTWNPQRSTGQCSRKRVPARLPSDSKLTPCRNSGPLCGSQRCHETGRGGTLLWSPYVRCLAGLPG